MNFFEYKKRAEKTAIYPGKGEFKGLMYVSLGLAGEAGEYAEKMKKFIRDDNCIITKERRDLIVKELGDVLWYVANVANELHLDMEEIAINNLEKLNKRKEENKLHGDGDNR